MCSTGAVSSPKVRLPRRTWPSAEPWGMTSTRLLRRATKAAATNPATSEPRTTRS